MASTKTILVTGATGRQGKALISALRPLCSPSDSSANPAFHVLALTRRAESSNAKQLATEKHVTVVQADLDSPDSVRRLFDERGKGGIWGVFCVLAFPGLGANADGEEKQGKTLADLSLEYGVSSFIYSSVERGGEAYDDHLKLDRLAKVRIERHIRQLGTRGLPWTILRPGFFMENYDGTIGSITVAVLKAGLKSDTTVQLVAVEDIGHVAAGIFQTPEMYASQILVVVGEVSTMRDQEEAYKAVTGRSLPSIPALLARVLIAINGHTRELINDIERIHRERNSNESPDETQSMDARSVYPEMRTFRAWAEQRKGTSSVRDKNWNQVTVPRLITGKQ